MVSVSDVVGGKAVIFCIATLQIVMRFSILTIILGLCLHGVHSSFLSHIEPVLSLKRLYRLGGFPFREDPDFGNRRILREYDFVVVGSGPAGSVIANRLSENPKWNVLLLEAGVDETLFNEIPGTAAFLQFTDYNWNYTTEPQDGSCLGLINGRCPWPAGKGTGGSSLINNNMYTRGKKQDFDDWFKAGNKGWSYDEVLPYFLKTENINIAPLKGSPYHNAGGPLTVEHAPFETKLVNQFFKAFNETGSSFVDYNNPNTREGHSRIQATIKNGKRVSAYRAFIRPYKERKNLHVAIRSRVTRIMINHESKEAYGVEFIKAKKRRKVRALKEVILSAGAFNSPQLLMLSGVGPQEHLDSIGIPVIHDLRVGDNLQEHPAFAGLAFTINQTNLSPAHTQLQNKSIPLLANWTTSEGTLTILPCEGLGYVHTKYNNRTKDAPDIELIFFPMSLADQPGSHSDVARKTMGIPYSTYKEVFGDIEGQPSWTICVMLLRPLSRGIVRLKSTNPWQPPRLQSNFFAESEDLYRLVEGIKIVLNLSETAAFRSFGSTLNRKPLPACKAFKFGSDGYWACCIRQWTMQMHHQSGTCKMGPEWDRNAVVGPRLTVHGIKNLRVVDASVMPKIPGAHIVASVYMIGEKGADMIKEDWNWTNPKGL